MSYCHIDINSTKTKDWIIHGESSDRDVFPVMYHPYEYAGAFTLDYLSGKNCSSGVCIGEHSHKSEVKQCNKGQSTSVKTIDGYCNFHTHPLDCYKGENTIWGWPSGEDMRECVGFALRGNLVHMVYTMEGIYTIQLNPNIVSFIISDNNMKELIPEIKNPNLTRGIIINLIESYFKATHGHRTSEYNEQHHKKVSNTKTKSCLTSNSFGVCMPKDWVDYANSFTIGSLLKNHPKKCSTVLPCNGFPEYTKRNSTTLDLRDYLKRYGFEMYEVNKDGKIYETKSKINVEKILIDNIDRISQIFNSIPNQLSYGSEKWNQGQWFNVNIFYTKMVLKNKLVPFNIWITELKKLCGSDYRKLCNTICNYWGETEKAFKTNGQQMIKFPDVSISFKPFKPQNKHNTCSLENDKNKQLLGWIKGSNSKGILNSKSILNSSSNIGRRKSVKKRKQSKKKK